MAIDVILETETPLGLLPLRSTEDRQLVVEIERETGTWDYKAGLSGTVVVPANAKVLGITAIAATSGGSVSINGGDSIPLSRKTFLSFEPHGNLVAPTIVFSGTSLYIVEYVL